MILVALLSFAIIYAQGNANKGRKNGANEKVKILKTVKGAPDQSIVPYTEDEPPGNAYGRNKKGLSGREFGQQRAAEAKAKHKSPKSESDAVNLISVIREETRETIENVQDRIEEARHRLGTLLEHREISEEDFNLKSSLLDFFVDRATSLIKKL